MSVHTVNKRQEKITKLNHRLAIEEAKIKSIQSNRLKAQTDMAFSHDGFSIRKKKRETAWYDYLLVYLNKRAEKVRRKIQEKKKGMIAQEKAKCIAGIKEQSDPKLKISQEQDQMKQMDELRQLLTLQKQRQEEMQGQLNGTKKSVIEG